MLSKSIKNGGENLKATTMFAQIINYVFEKVKTSILSYPVVTLLGDVGGYLGALLGMSLLDLNKVFYWLYNLYLQRFN